MLTLSALNECFDYAIFEQYAYVAVRIAIGLNKEEIIINPKENFAQKKAYYNHAYNESLRHKFSGDDDIRITGFVYGDDFSELESKLELYDFSGNLN